MINLIKALLLVLLGAAILGAPLLAQDAGNITQSQVQDDTTKMITVYYGIVDARVRRQLDSLWSEKPAQLERAYCVGVTQYYTVWAYKNRTRIGRDVLVRVMSIYPAKVSGASQYGIFSVECDTPDTPTIHTHPPSTCRYDNIPESCYRGGDEAWQCQASRLDYATMIRKKQKFAIVQCDRNAFRFYWPHEYRP